MLAIAERLEGLYSNASTHAAGVVIGDRPLTELVPLYRDPKAAMPATQFNMKWVEPAGLVKFDFLGLKTLTTLQRAVDLIARRGVAIDLGKIPLDDAKTYEMLGRGETVGVFQVESAGMRKALVEMRADRFEDIIALVALYRPGPMANIPTYCARKLGQEKPDTIHPMIEPVLRETFGVIIYQEQVMQIAQVLSGYSLGEADMLRRAMGKKIKKEMDAQRARFVDGAVERGLAKAKADEIFDLLAKFADYGFNKSHAAAYALIAYWTGWFKANHPAEFLAASMTLDKGNTDKLAEFRAEAQRLGIRVAPPSANASEVDFDVRVGADGRRDDRLCAERHQGRRRSAGGGAGRRRAAASPFASLADMARRLDPRLVNKKALESLAAAGTFDELEPDRAVVFAAIEPMLAIANRGASEKASGQNALFGEAEAAPLKVARAPWTEAEKLKREFDAVGFFLSGHPLEAYDTALKRLRADALGRFRPLGARRRLDRAARRERARPHRAAHQERLEDGHRPALRPVRAIRGDHLPGGAEPVPRPARKGVGRAGDAAGQGRGRGRARAASSTSSGSTTPPPRSARACASSCATRARSPRSRAGSARRATARCRWSSCSGRRTARSRSACPAATPSAPRSPARSRPRPAWWRSSRCRAGRRAALARAPPAVAVIPA